MKQKKEKGQKAFGKGRWITVILMTALLLAAVFLVPPLFIKQKEVTVVTTAALERIVELDELSTLSSVYNGIAQGPSKKNPEETGYYVSYEAKVKAGIDFSEVLVSLDEENQNIIVKVPPVKITEIEVDITSLDYIFLDNACDVPAVSAEAYRVCEQDVREESEAQQAIYELAEQNAKNTLTALVQPLIEQLDGAYTLVVL